MNAVDELQESASAGKLVVVMGAGVSLALNDGKRPARTWAGLLESAFRFAKQKGKINDVQLARWTEALSSPDMDELLGAAEFIIRKLGGRAGLLYARWLEGELGPLRAGKGPMEGAVAALVRANVPICTLNYDTLIEQAASLPSLTLHDTRKVMEWARKEAPGILHLHGIWDNPQSVVLGVSDYNEAVDDKFREALQRSLSMFNRLLFVGCGETLQDPNFSSLIEWSRRAVGGAALQHYGLIKSDEVDLRHRDTRWHGFIDPVSYGDTYADLPKFISGEILKKVPAAGARTNRPSKVDSDVINRYREFLVSDCGQMTIEGVRADADTAKQKFDIERLFVPLQVAAIPPEIPESDPKREEKLKRWQKEYADPVPFGQALKTHPRLALLALPGGGKTLLLKRLAVAYAEPKRRTAIADALPATDLLPILIRCREWRDHIKLPISTLIGRISEISGRPELAGLLEALDARLKSGRIVLLVDGLDEIHSDSDRSSFVENLDKFLEEFPKIRMVVTSREAGFALVAPSLSRFCSKWKIAPLSEEAIVSLCTHWHNLMGGSGKDAADELLQVTTTILGSEALRRLAENPLLLTMLLVVKHGYGRLPPDRVSLYERAVEVLLDTWNIKGHAALNPREAVPQLAFLALRLVQQGKQTATERELLELIEQSRQDVPLVRLYARDTPSEFLKRVELRSSLLLEAGRMVEDGRAVPFYQFRHLTFQEYLAAVAVVDGHYSGYRQGESILSPFGSSVTSDEWKEIVPMAAVLAKKQADPLISKLISLGMEAEKDFVESDTSEHRHAYSPSYRMPAPVSRLTQCLIEEAEFSVSNIDDALRLVATFAHGCLGPENWPALMRGPFGQALFEKAWVLYASHGLPRQAYMRNTTALMGVYRRDVSQWVCDSAIDELRGRLIGEDQEQHGQTAATICGIIWTRAEESIAALGKLQPELEAGLDSTKEHIWEHMAWALALLHAYSESSKYLNRLKTSSLDILVRRWFQVEANKEESVVDFAIGATFAFRRKRWIPKLDFTQIKLLEIALDREASDTGRSEHGAAALIAYHARILDDESILIPILRSVGGRAGHGKDIGDMVASLGADLGSDFVE
ncbi:MAG: NACHT domain-containing protein [Alphaproteobacteria bacterium]|nr:MAG: NACHT domain-containing protein [Alphaproteobacteria bacterium]